AVRTALWPGALPCSRISPNDQAGRRRAQGVKSEAPIHSAPSVRGGSRRRRGVRSGVDPPDIASKRHVVVRDLEVFRGRTAARLLLRRAATAAAARTTAAGPATR